MIFKVWSCNQDEKHARSIVAWDADEAAREYAENDVDGNTDGCYSDRNGQPMDTAFGHVVHVREEDGTLRAFKVAIVDYEAVYDAEEVK